MAAKEYDYLVTLKTNTTAIVNTVSLLLLIIAVFFFGYAGFRLMPYSSSAAWKPIAVAAFIFIWIMIRFVAMKKPYFRLALLAAGVYLLFSGLSFYWIGFLYIIAGILEKPAKVPQELGFDESGVTVNSLIPKQIAWNELSNVLIKDNLFTMDFKNNKIFQKELQNEITKETETEFNEFCAKYLRNNLS